MAVRGPGADEQVGGRLRRLAPPAVLFVLLAAGWELAVRATSDNILLPTFGDTVIALFRLIGDGAVWEALWLSNQTMLIGFALSVLCAVPVGFLMGRLPYLDRVMNPWIAVLVATPMAPLLPIIVIVLGLGIGSALLVVFLFCFVYMVINTRAGIRSIDPGLIEMARSFGAGELARWRYVLIPGAMPAIGTGLRICLGRAFAGMILGELLMFSRGVGLLMLDFRGAFEAASLFGLVFLLLVEALLIGLVMRRVEARIANRFD
jgi:ABC-type nitrate/sulfonate/bicarbonate transport system permease component